jgi:hypothetical protein
MTSNWYCGLPGPEFIGHGQWADRLGHPGGAKLALPSQEVEGGAAGVARASPAASPPATSPDTTVGSVAPSEWPASCCSSPAEDGAPRGWYSAPSLSPRLLASTTVGGTGESTVGLSSGPLDR